MKPIDTFLCMFQCVCVQALVLMNLCNSCQKYVLVLKEIVVNVNFKRTVLSSVSDFFCTHLHIQIYNSVSIVN